MCPLGSWPPFCVLGNGQGESSTAPSEMSHILALLAACSYPIWGSYAFPAACPAWGGGIGFVEADHLQYYVGKAGRQTRFVFRFPAALVVLKRALVCF